MPGNRMNIWTVDKATIRAEITKRNALRKSALLPLLDEQKKPPRCLVWVATASRGADLVFLGSAESRFSAPA